MPVKHLNYWRHWLPDALYVNLYGPTEITCNCTYYIVDRAFTEDELIPIGEAFPNERVLLLDEEEHPVTEPGRLGEICVLGTALASWILQERRADGSGFCAESSEPVLSGAHVPDRGSGAVR